jgi:hypothetical protein
MVFDKGATTKATELGYLTKLCRKGGSSIAAGWKVGWRPGMKPSEKNASTVMSNCKDVQVKKSRGSKYYANLVSRPTKFLLAALANLNPTPPTLGVPLSKKKPTKELVAPPTMQEKNEVVPTLVSVPTAAARKRSTSSTTVAGAAAAAPENRANQITATKEES